MSAVIFHVAGALRPDGVQRCARCGFVLSDYRDTMVPHGSPPLMGWEPGSRIVVLEGNPRHTYVLQGAGLGFAACAAKGE
jgi:hypothetical protein